MVCPRTSEFTYTSRFDVKIACDANICIASRSRRKSDKFGSANKNLNPPSTVRSLYIEIALTLGGKSIPTELKKEAEALRKELPYDEAQTGTRQDL
jgi:hypothetical protein